MSDINSTYLANSALEVFLIDVNMYPICSHSTSNVGPVFEDAGVRFICDELEVHVEQRGR